jgi:uncharacterized membrane protein YdbT with pleckstrin-like domain
MSASERGSSPGREPHEPHEPHDGPRRPPILGRPGVRRILSRIVVIIGAAFAVGGVLTGRYGYLVVGIVVIGLGAALGPGRIRR